MTRTVIGWENFELLHNSAGGILIKYIGNIFTGTKADVSQELDSFRRGQGLHASRLASSQVSQAQPILCLTVPCPSLFLSLATGCSGCPGLGLFCCSAGTGWQRGQKLVLPPARAACRGKSWSGGPGGHFSRSCRHLKLDILGISVAANSILTASLSRMDTRDVTCDNQPLLARIACWPTATALGKFRGGYDEKGELSKLWSNVSYLF